MDPRLRHRQTKGAATVERATYGHRATSRLYRTAVWAHSPSANANRAPAIVDADDVLAEQVVAQQTVKFRWQLHR
jgi:hypothetical protein